MKKSKEHETELPHTRKKIYKTERETGNKYIR